MLDFIKNPYQEFWSEYDLAKDVIPNITSILSSLASELENIDANKLINSATDTAHQLQEIMKPYSAQFQELQDSIAQALLKLNLEDYQSLKTKCEDNLNATLELLQNPPQDQSLEETCDEVEHRVTDLVSVIDGQASELCRTLVQRINTPMSPAEQRLVAYLPLFISIISLLLER